MYGVKAKTLGAVLNVVQSTEKMRFSEYSITMNRLQNISLNHTAWIVVVLGRLQKRIDDTKLIKAHTANLKLVKIFMFDYKSEKVQIL